MDRKEFLKSVCGLGVCGCALPLVGWPTASRAAEAPAAADGAAAQRQAFMRYELAKLVGHLAADTEPAACAGVLEKTGRECARLGQLAAQFKGDLPGYLAAIKEAWGTDSTRDEAAGLVSVVVAPGECGCPLVDPKRMPAVWCSCSVGYQKESFETVLGRPVAVTLKESKLSGAERCVFEIRMV